MLWHRVAKVVAVERQVGKQMVLEEGLECCCNHQNVEVVVVFHRVVGQGVVHWVVVAAGWHHQ